MTTSPVVPADSTSQPGKLADTVPGVHELIRSRWSPRAFSNKEVSKEDLVVMLEAARWAASCFNEQPWRFLVAPKSDPAAFAKFLNLLVPANQVWAKEASVLLITAAKRMFSHQETANHYGMHDTGAALANLFLQATALGLQGHGMGGFDRERARQDLSIPDDYEVAAAVALGYPGSPDSLPEKYRDMELAPRKRKPLGQIAFGSAWDSLLF